MSTNGHLEFLEHAGLVQRVQIQPELEYLFRHALMQEAAYESLLKRERKRLHLAVGEVLEQLYPERLDDLALVLAQHFADGGQDQQALAYFKHAGDVAARVYANAEAVMHYRRALEIAKRRLAVAEPAEGEARAAFAHLYGALGHALE